MQVILLLVAILWVAAGAALILYTNQTRNSLRGFVLGVHIRTWGIAALAVGLLFTLGAFRAPGVFWLVLAIGLLATGKGLYLLLAPQTQVRGLLEWWFDRAAETVLRLWGLVVYTLGVALLLWLL